jgi:hypothetical protein
LLAFIIVFASQCLIATTIEAKEANTPTPATDAPPPTIPTGKGLPVVIHTAVFFNHIDSFDYNKGAFEATTDVRMSWEDPRLRYPVSEGLNGHKEYRASAAEIEIAKIWTPQIRVVNRIGEPSFSERRLRLFPDGKVEIIARTTAEYKTPIDMTHFPFDHQPLEIELAVREDTIETVDLDFSQDDVKFSRAAKKVEISGWNIGIVNLKRLLVSGWNGDRYAKVIASLNVQRLASSTVATIFIPLFASLLIPFLATWMNKAQDGGFAINAFELANVLVGGLFAVIALGFTISSTYPIVVANDSTVTRLIGLNYVALSIGLIITVVFYRYSLPKRFFGACVQEQMFRFLTWAFPLLFLSIGLAFVLVAAA